MLRLRGGEIIPSKSKILILTLSFLYSLSAFAQTTLTPDTLQFGSQVVFETSAPKTVTFKNTQTVAVAIGLITIRGASATDFEWGGNCPLSPSTLGAGKSCSITVEFMPSTLAFESATLTVTRVGASSSQSVPMNGNGVVPVTLSTASLPFGNQAEGAQSASQTVTINNVQAGPLTINTVSVTGPFTQTGGTCPLKPATLPAATSCTLLIAFTPTAVATQTGTLFITHNASNSPQSVSLTGTGITPVTLSTNTLSLSSVAVGNVSASKTVTLTNQENIPLNLSSVGVSGPFAVASNTCGASINAGATCTVGVTFTPTALGAAGGTLTFTDNAVNNPQTVSLSGIGVTPVTVSPSSLTFASTTIGVTAAAQTITLTNALSTSLTIGTITATGDYAVASNTCGSKVSAGVQCKIGITFTPTVVGSRSGTLTLNYVAFGSPTLVTLSGTGNVTGLTTLTVTPAKATIPLGTTQQYAASGKFSSGSTQNLTASVTWTSSSTGTATITAAGLVTSAGQGGTTIQAALGSIHGTTTLTVAAPALVSLAVTPALPSISQGNTQQFTATGTFTDGSTQNVTNSVTWNSSLTGVATINSSGVASGLGLGTTTLQATSGVVNATAKLTVTSGFLPTGSLNTPRFAHTATMLNNGLILFAGGVGSAGNSLSSAELYNPATASSNPTGNLNTPRAWHTATLLDNGSVLIAGGVNGASLATAEIYNPATGIFTPTTGAMTTSREYHTATLLNNGMVLIAGGLSSGASLSSAELFDPTASTFSVTGSLNNARYWQAATLLNDGTVLITGGQTNAQTLASPVGEIYNFSTRSFSLTPTAMTTARSAHTATLLNGGMVLLAGGNGGTDPLASAELYDPVARTFSVTGILNTARSSGRATLLNNGRVLIFGGVDANGNSLSSAELFDPTKGMFIITGGLHTARYGDTVILLSNGNVLSTGGLNGSAYLASGEIYQPATFVPAGLVSISVTPATPTLPKGTAQSFVATGTFNGSSPQTLASVIWTTSNSAVAAIADDSSNSSTAYGVATGSSTISACAGAICGSTSVTIAPPALVSLAVTPVSPSIPAGTAQQYTATGTYTDGSTQVLTSSATWSSSATAVATVNTVGLATSFIQGGTTITATLGAVQGAATLTVTAPVLTSIAVTPASPSIALGLTRQFTATGTYSDGSKQNMTNSVTWSSSATGVATINNAALATSVKQGSTTIAASSGAVQGTAVLTVTAPALVSIAITPANPSVPLGLQQQFAATGTYTDGSTRNLTAPATWSSSSSGVAMFGANGLAATLNEGSTTVQALLGSIHGSTTFTVTAPALVSIALTPLNTSTSLGTAQQFSATGTFTDGSRQNLTNTVTWTSSESPATINAAGLASAVALGSTTIEASSGVINSATNLNVTPGFLVTGTLNTPRLAHSATMLNNGLILFAGGVGSDGNSLASAELYNPATGNSTATGNLNTARAWHTATLLNNGTVLIAGGCSGCSPGVGGTSLADAEIYNPSTGMFSPTGSMTTIREYHTATLLTNGMVLISGGLASGASLNSAELYDPAAEVFTATGSLNNARYLHAATLLNDGTVLVTGGGLAAPEIYNPSVGIFTGTANNMTAARSAHTATLLNGGMVLLSGGNSSGNAELYDSVAQTFTAVGRLNTARYSQLSMLLNNGTVLIAGGEDYSGNDLSAAEIFDPSTGLFTPTGSLSTARLGATATLLNNGMVLTAGGSGGTTYPSSVEQYEPATYTPPGLISISVSPISQNIPAGAAQRFIATGTFSGNTLQSLASVTWSSSNNAAVPIADDATNTGTAFAFAPGTSIINACAGSLCGSTTASVAAPALVSIAVSPAAGSIPAGTSQQYTATGTYTDGTTQNLTSAAVWTSSATGIATINSAGLATSSTPGGTTIEATVGSIQGSTPLTVIAPILVSIAVAPPTSSIALGLSQQFTATGTFTDGSTQNVTAAVTWGTSTSAATISSVGLATSVNQGGVLISASSGALQGSASLSITAPALTAISVTPANSSLALGLSQQLTATGIYTDGSTQNLTGFVTWSSSASSIASINGAGLASSAKEGGTTIQALSGSIHGSTLLTVTAPALVSIALTPASPSIPLGSTQQFTATGTYTDSSTQNVTSSVTWSSSSTDLASINSVGLATAMTTGPATISAASGLISGSASLLVIAPANLYVAVNGNDQWSGTLPVPNATSTDGPFASIAMAQIAMRNLISANPGQPLSVMLRNGTYYLPLSATNPGTLNFTSADSGTANAQVTWQNYPAETPVVSGGIPLGNNWTNVSGNLWQTPLPANTQPFEYLFYNGQRRLRSRVAGPTGVGYYMNSGACYSTTTGQTVEQSQCNLGTFLRVAAEIAPTGPDASCPSITSSDGTQSKCLDRFGYNPSDPIAEWINLNASASSCGGPSSGYPAGDIELTLFDAWTVDVMRISCIDTTRHIIHFVGTTKGNASNYNYFGPTLGHRYTIENTLDAFNAAQSSGETGIWFFDRSTSPWTLNYLANSGENPNTDSVEIGQLSAATSTGGSLMSAINLSYATFQGITFEVDNFIPPATGFNNDENGENTLPAAIDCESCQNVTFDSVILRHTSATGLQIASTSGNSGLPASNDLIQNSAFYDIGASGIHIGHHPLGTDRAANVVQQVTVQNNIVQGYSRVFADGEGLAQGNGHDVTYLHNDITDGYHAGISICMLGCPSVGFAASGVNIVSQYNHIWNVMQGITSDGGTLYYNVGAAGGSGTGNKILNNLLHDVTDSSIIDNNIKGSGYGGRGIYLDNQSAGVDSENNVVYRMAGATVYIHEAPALGQIANTFNNNIFAYARVSMFVQQNPWPHGCNVAPSPQVNVSNNIFYFDLSDSAGFYVTNGCADTCSLPYSQFQNFQGNLYWRTDGQFSTYAEAFHVLTSPLSGTSASTCGAPANPNSAWTFLTFSQWQNSTPLVKGSPLQVSEDGFGTASVNPGFGVTGLPSDYQLSVAPVAGFNYANTNDTLLNAGRNNPVIMPPTVPATYPTYNFTQF
ncbi:MAG TPA: Ig-like domain-containing protein [Bryobacteraceae bacterium]|nr:Ig-like domain-containing protein [Bryobacteraceae bacterium]